MLTDVDVLPGALVTASLRGKAPAYVVAVDDDGVPVVCRLRPGKPGPVALQCLRPARPRRPVRSRLHSRPAAGRVPAWPQSNRHLLPSKRKDDCAMTDPEGEGSLDQLLHRLHTEDRADDADERAAVRGLFRQDDDRPHRSHRPPRPPRPTTTSREV